jgi:dipeptidyl aminopeptidase/acylaminoacyl peptidase
MKKVFSSFFLTYITFMYGSIPGSYKSPISAEMVAESSKSVRQILVSRDDIYLVESRPSEKGRSLLVNLQTSEEITPNQINIRTLVHEYGGKCATFHDDVFYVSNFEDQNIYKIDKEKKAKAITFEKNKRFADFVCHPNGKWLYSVMESHESAKVKNCLVKIDIATGSIEEMNTSHDFYASPRISPDGKRLCYIFWDHPNMPWDQTELWVYDLNENGDGESEKKISGLPSESLLEPSFSPSGKLFFISDRNGFWNLYNEDNECIYEHSADFSSPLWLLGIKSYTFVEQLEKKLIAAIYTEKAIDSLVLIDLDGHKINKIELDYCNLSEIHTLDQNLIFLAKGTKNPQQIVQYDISTNDLKVLKELSDLKVDPSFISVAELVEYPSLGGKKGYAFFYPPLNPDYAKPTNDKPPLIVMAHGGPTSHVNPSLKLNIQYWTSRGFSVLDVNYGGSSGYGKEYRNRLKKNFGVLDVFDVCSAAKNCVEKGFVDEKKLIIEGASAGGYTTLAAITFKNVFLSGTSYFGVSDLIKLQEETHKFESHYLYSLIGKYPEEKNLYLDRSPIFHSNSISCPLLFIQGGQDKIVPPNQAEKMFKEICERKIPTAYILFEEEAHGFRQSQNIATSLKAQLSFYRQIFQIQSTEKNFKIEMRNPPES